MDSFRRYSWDSTGHKDKFKKQHIERKRVGPGFQWLRHWLHQLFRRVREVRLNQCKLDFLGKVREGNQTEREKERAEVKVFWSNGILVILIIG